MRVISYEYLFGVEFFYCLFICFFMQKYLYVVLTVQELAV